MISIVPLTLAECRRLVEVAKTPRFRDCLPALGLMLFAGVRPGEVARLSWADVHSEEGVLSIAARHSKTGGARWVPDVLRHTFAMTHRNLPALQLQLGHRDARLLLTRYLNLHPLRRKELAPFWNLPG